VSPGLPRAIRAKKYEPHVTARQDTTPGIVVATQVNSLFLPLQFADL